MITSSKIKDWLPIGIGFVIWLLALFKQIPYSIFELSHVQALLIAAPLWLIPMAWQIAKKDSWIIWTALSSGIFFTISYQLPKGLIPALLILPWLILSALLAIKKVLYFDHLSLKTTTELAGYLYLPVGIFWAITDRLGIPLFGYDPTIILLTAVHFHYAGFILPQVTSWLIGQQNTKINTTASLGVILGIPLVAIGISTTHFNWPGWLEVCCVSVMTIAGIMVGGLYIRFGLQTKRFFSKALFILGGCALSLGMVLALCYGWRHVFIIETLTIPWMYAVHGTCNAVGFAAPVLLGWKLMQQDSLAT